MSDKGDRALNAAAAERYYRDEKVYRTGSEPNLEVSRYRGDDDALVISIDSWDAPEASIRLRADQVRGLLDFLLRRP